MLGLIIIQTVWHSDGTPERNFRKVDFEKSSRCQKNMKNYQVGKVLSFLVCFQDELRIVISTRDHLVRAVSGNLKYVLGYPVVSKLNKFEP